VCDRAANEDCGPLPGLPIAAHWGVPDPATAAPAERMAAFEAAYDALNARIARLAALPLDELDPVGIQRRVDAVGHAQPAVGG
jgi:hypothetical protein